VAAASKGRGGCYSMGGVGRRERKRWGTNRRDKEERERERGCANAAAVLLKIRKSCHSGLLFYYFSFSGWVIGSLTPKNHFQ